MAKLEQGEREDRLSFCLTVVSPRESREVGERVGGKKVGRELEIIRSSSEKEIK